MEKVAFDLIMTRKGVSYGVFNSKWIPILGLTGILSLLGFAFVSAKVYDINLRDYTAFNFIGFIFLIFIFIGILKYFGDFNGDYFEKKGLLFLDANAITIDYTNVYSLDKVKYIKFHISESLEGYLFAYDKGKLRRCYGAANFITFQLEENTYTHQFIITSEGQKQLLIEKVIPKLQSKTKVSFMNT